MKKNRVAVVWLLLGIAITACNTKPIDEIRQPAVEKAVDQDSFWWPTSTHDQVVQHQFYTLSYSETHEQAEWVYYNLTSKQLSRQNYKRPFFEIDTQVKTKAAHWRNYKNTGYDKGHLCPAGDRKFSKAAFEETFLTSNCTPQLPEFNAGIWNRLEEKVRFWATQYGSLHIITGGVLPSAQKTIGFEQVAVPRFFYKIILRKNAETIKTIAFLLPHQESDRPLNDFVVPIDSIESQTGIDFFPQLEDSVEQIIESQSNYKEWMHR